MEAEAEARRRNAAQRQTTREGCARASANCHRLCFYFAIDAIALDVDEFVSRHDSTPPDQQVQPWQPGDPPTTTCVRAQQEPTDRSEIWNISVH